MRDLKIAIIGAGSTYSPELFEGLIKRREMLSVREIALMDIDTAKLGIVDGLIRRMLKAEGIGAGVLETDDLDAALDGADYVLVQIRVGGLQARALDERIPLKYDLIGQETTGIGAFSRRSGQYRNMRIARRMEALCPDAVLINFANPSGLVAEAVQNNSKVRMAGLCNIPINMFAQAKKLLGEDIGIRYLGLNHLS